MSSKCTYRQSNSIAVNYFGAVENRHAGVHSVSVDEEGYGPGSVILQLALPLHTPVMQANSKLDQACMTPLLEVETLINIFCKM